MGIASRNSVNLAGSLDLSASKLTRRCPKWWCRALMTRCMINDHTGEPAYAYICEKNPKHRVAYR